MRLHVFRAQLSLRPNVLAPIYGTAPKCPSAQMSAPRCLTPKCLCPNIVYWPLDPSRVFWFLNQLQITVVLPKKNTLEKNVEIIAPYF